MKKITIDTIAKKAKVTPATVSLVINDHPRIPEKTKEKIRKIMHQLNYRPSTEKVALAKGRTDTIAVISISFSAWYEMMLIRGIEKEMGDSNYFLTQISTSGNKKREKEIMYDLIYSKKADGLISFSVIPSKEILNEIKRNKFPFVIVGEKIYGLCSIYFNDYKGAFIATEHLINRGRKKLAIISQKQIKGWTSRDVVQRLKGFLNAIKKHEIKDYKIIEVSNVYFEDGIKACIEIQKYKDISGVFCAAGDNTAIGFIKQARKDGINIPDDIAIVGYDDSEIATAITPEITTIRQPVLSAGETAFTFLLEQIQNKTIKDNVVYEPELIIRQTT